MKGKIGLWLLIPLALFGMFVGGLMTWHHDTQLYGGADDQGELIGCTESAARRSRSRAASARRRRSGRADRLHRVGRG